MTRRERTESREFAKLLNFAEKECDTELRYYYDLADRVMARKCTTKKEREVHNNTMALVGSAIAQEYDMSICLGLFAELHDRTAFLEKRLREVGVLKRTMTYAKKKLKRRERLFQKIEQHYADSKIQRQEIRKEAIRVRKRKPRYFT